MLNLNKEKLELNLKEEKANLAKITGNFAEVNKLLIEFILYL